MFGYDPNSSTLSTEPSKMDTMSPADDKAESIASSQFTNDLFSDISIMPSSSKTIPVYESREGKVAYL